MAARADDEANLLDAGGDGFFDDDFEGGLGFAVAVHQALQRQRMLVATGGSDDSFFNFHGTSHG